MPARFVSRVVPQRGQRLQPLRPQQALQRRRLSSTAAPPGIEFEPQPANPTSRGLHNGSSLPRHAAPRQMPSQGTPPGRFTALSELRASAAVMVNGEWPRVERAGELPSVRWRCHHLTLGVARGVTTAEGADTDRIGLLVPGRNCGLPEDTESCADVGCGQDVSDLGQRRPVSLAAVSSDRDVAGRLNCRSRRTVRRSMSVSSESRRLSRRV